MAMIRKVPVYDKNGPPTLRHDSWMAALAQHGTVGGGAATRQQRDQQHGARGVRLPGRRRYGGGDGSNSNSRSKCSTSSAGPPANNRSLVRLTRRRLPCTCLEPEFR